MSLDKHKLAEALRKKSAKESYKLFDFKKFAFDKQYEFFRGSESRFNVAVTSRRCLAKGTMVQTTEGAKPIEDIKVGEFVYDEFGSPVEVVNTFYNGVLLVFKLQIEDLSVNCTLSHEFQTIDSQGKKDVVTSVWFLRAKNTRLVVRNIDTQEESYPLLTSISDGHFDHVYDIHVNSPTNLYMLANGLITHNSGKTVGIAGDAIDTCLSEDNVTCLYLTITSNSARSIIWHDALYLLEKHKIQASTDTNRLTITFANHSRFILGGAKDSVEIEKYRGWKLKRCYIDECQSFRPYLRDLINDIIVPCLRDLRGKLFLTGTPGPVPAGVFYDYSQSKNWNSKHWTAFDNPHMHNPPELDLDLTLDEELIAKGIDRNDPSFLRETYGQWVYDENSLVFKFNKNKNVVHTLPPLQHYVIGIDIGYNDADAISVIGFNSDEKKVYLVEEDIQNKQDITTLVEKIRYYKDKYTPYKMVMDAGALGKKIQEEILARHGLYILAAEKSRKREFIELLNDDLRTGKFFALPNSRFEQDSYLVQWDKESISRNPENPKVSDAVHSDILDSILYSWREAHHYHSEKHNDPVKNTDDYMTHIHAQEASDMQRQMEDPDGFAMEKMFDEDFSSYDQDLW